MQTYDALFQKITWPDGPLELQFEAGDMPPPTELISNVNAVPFTGPEQWVVIRLADGTWQPSGGTLDAGESVMESLRRELLEEAGAHVVDARYIGAWKMYSHAPQPFRPHLPHPLSYRVVYLCRVEIVGPPQIPETGGELVVAVEQVPLERVVRYFHGDDRPELADLYRWAAARLRASEPPDGAQP